MKLRNLPNLLLSTSSLFFYLINLCKSAAPADLPAGCPAVSASQRALLDSCCYSTLLPSPWSVADVNMDGIMWTAVAGEGTCSQNVMVCNASDDWLITQYINTTLGIGLMASEVQVDIIFSCTGDCSSGLDLFYYPIDTEQSQSVVTTLPDNSFIRVGQVSNGSNTVTGITTAGFYLAVRATTTVCVTVHQISIILTVCGEDTVNLITFPEAYASTTYNMTDSCSANSEPSGSESLTGTCGDNGMWTTSSSCVCSPGHFLENDVCTACPSGTYKSTAGNEACSSCPQNSMTMSMGSTNCTCQTNYRRPNSAAVNVGCSECVANFFLAGGGICTECPENSMSSGGSNCTCITNYQTMSGAGTTTGDICMCREGYHIDSSSQCVQCPAYSMRDITSPSFTCTCASNRRTESGGRNTSGTVPCSGCESGYFLMNGMCVACPYNSDNAQPSSSSCICKGLSVTERLMDTTTMENCSNCPVNWRARAMTSPLVCEACPERSERPLDANFDICTCMTGYKMKSSNNMCLAEVIFPSERSILSEGSAENPAKIPLTLSASSYELSVRFNIGVEDLFRNRISPSNNVMFQVGVTEANIMVLGDDVALSPSFNVTITVLSNDDYFGDGTIEATIVDDDYVGVGFLDPQPVMFNESDDVVSVILRTNVTTAQAIQVNVVVSPQDRSVSVLSNPIMLAAGNSTDTHVMLKIQDDVIGGQEDKSITLRLELESPIAFGRLIDLNHRGNGLTDQLTIIIKDDDPPRTSPFALNVTTIIGIAAAAAGLAILIVLILLVCVCICRFNANRQGFYITEEDKTVNPPSMLRYSASLRSISSQAVVPAMDGKGQLAEKENEFYV